MSPISLAYVVFIVLLWVMIWDCAPPPQFDQPGGADLLPLGYLHVLWPSLYPFISPEVQPWARIIVMSCQVRRNLNPNLINPSLNLLGFSQEPVKPILIDSLFSHWERDMHSSTCPISVSYFWNR